MIPPEVWQQQFESVHGPGEIMSGSDMTNEQAMQYALEHFPGGQYCIVRLWVWTDHIVSADLRIELAKSSFQPATVYADSIVFDSEVRFEPGDWVRTSPLRDFKDGFIFQTRNTAYLLLGVGYRKRPASVSLGPPKLVA